jgi:hypothetical protein
MKVSYVDIQKYKYIVAQDIEYETGIEPPNRVAFEYEEKSKGILLVKFTLYPGGKMRVYKGTLYNGADVVLDTEDIMDGALAHDMICRASDVKVKDGGLPYKPYRALGDKMMKKINIANGMPEFRAEYVERGS